MRGWKWWDMPKLELSEVQVVELVKQLPPEQHREVLLALAEDATRRREEQRQFAEGQLRRVVAARGLDWDTMSEQGREAFADNLVHEDRR